MRMRRFRVNGSGSVAAGGEKKDKPTGNTSPSQRLKGEGGGERERGALSMSREGRNPRTRCHPCYNVKAQQKREKKGKGKKKEGEKLPCVRLSAPSSVSC